jgi:hypothetical protein
VEVFALVITDLYINYILKKQRTSKRIVTDILKLLVFGLLDVETHFIMYKDLIAFIFEFMLIQL